MAGHWAKHLGEIPVIFALTLANAATLVAYPYLLKWIIEGIERQFSVQQLLWDVLWLAVAGIGHAAIYAALQMRRVRLNLGFEYAMRLRAFEYVLRTGAEFAARFRTGDVTTRLMDDVTDKLSWYMCSGIFRVVEALSIIVFGVAMMCWISPELTLYTAGPLPILIGLFIFTANTLQRRYKAVQKSISELNDALESCFGGIRVVKAFTAEEQQIALIGAAIEKQRRAEVRAVRWQTVIDSLYGNIWQLAIVGVLLAGGGMAVSGRISLGDVVAFDAYVLLLVGPMFDIGQFLVRGKVSAVSIGRVQELEEALPEPFESGLSKPVSRTLDEPTGYTEAARAPAREPLVLRFEDVQYRFPKAEREALSRVEFVAKPGTLTAVVGEIGAGKSTLLALVPRLADPQAGRVVIGDRAVTEWDAGDLRGQIGYASQEAVLFSGTIADNVRFGRAGISDDDVRRALDTACLRLEPPGWPQGIETEIGSRGVRLSGGQKQRVALARALAGRPSILLLDDCTASLDAETEHRVWEQLLRELPNCTTLLATHRPSTLERVDQIIVLSQGKVEDIGTFAELNRPGTLFHRLYVNWQHANEENVA
jgi:ATP-binding cassette subfamily B protein